MMVAERRCCPAQPLLLAQAGQRSVVSPTILDILDYIGDTQNGIALPF